MYAIVDIETTGGHAAGSGITEVAIILHDGVKVMENFHTLINPERVIPAYITALTGISNAMVALAPCFSEVANEIFQLLQGNTFIAHNVNFDHSFLKHHLKQCGYDLVVKKLCTVRLSRKVFTGLPSYSLGNLCRSLSIPITNRHRAAGDARATTLLFEKILAHDGLVFINAMLKKSSSEQWLPLQLDKNIIEQLPAGPGVYYFHNAKGVIIYVGKAINIKKRVSSHFTHNDGEKKRQQFLRSITNITFKQCANELHALVLESTEIRRLWPKYNYSQKHPVHKYALYSFEDSRGYIRLAIDKRLKNFPSLYNFNLLHEGLVLLKNMVDEFDLNSKLCFLDKTPFTQKDIEFTEAPKYYNGKVKNALQSLENQLPTFAILDDGLTADEKLCLLVERGNFWGMGYLPARQQIKEIEKVKEYLMPYADNDFIRNSIYAFAEKYPEKKIELKKTTVSPNKF
ncbi:MAG: GIY-YIG nuclease family protein [Bacteroidetes bacterium]|nr:GIY-YIG nuclease family protein [Bacteroidota bacterium]MBS1756055.1 GIY-YIG nuclease family protein [Bacteroidota bacterium]